MANELRQRQLGIGGLVEDNPLTASATLFTSAGLASITGGVDTNHHMAVILDPDGTVGPPEVAYITNLTAGLGATGATGFARGQEGTNARQHLAGTPWLHGSTPRDVQRQIQKIDTSGTNATTNATAFGDIDATNLSALSIYGFIGDIFEWSLTASWAITGTGNAAYYDALITLPDASTTTFRALGSRSAAHTWEGASTGGDIQTFTIRGLYIATQIGVHTFKPQWRSNATSATVTLLRASGGTPSNPLHLIKNLGAPAD